MWRRALCGAVAHLVVAPAVQLCRCAAEEQPELPPYGWCLAGCLVKAVHSSPSVPSILLADGVFARAGTSAPPTATWAAACVEAPVAPCRQSCGARQPQGYWVFCGATLPHSSSAALGTSSLDTGEVGHVALPQPRPSRRGCLSYPWSEPLPPQRGTHSRQGLHQRPLHRLSFIFSPRRVKCHFSSHPPSHAGVSPG